MNSADDSRDLDGLYYRWKAFRTAGRAVAAAVLCRDRPDLADALAARIAVEHPEEESDADRTGGYTPSPDSGEEAPAETPTFGRYHIMREHAKGGMGRVCEAVDTELNRRVAFKDIQLKYADDASSRHRFVREALITGQLEHPGVIPVYGLGSDADGRPYYAMRFVEGESLKDALKRFHTDPPKRIPVGAKAVAFRGLLKRFADVCNAVAFAHSRNFVHRDLKPANVMLGPFGETLVVDWGLARSFKDKSADAPAAPNAPPTSGAEETDLAQATAITDDGVGTRTGQLMGTPAYMSPEQAAGELRSLGPTWDIYSLGATLFEVLTGQAPFTGKPVAELLRDIRAGRFRSPRMIAPWVPKPLDAAVRKAMALDSGDRYATALELAAEIDRYLADEPVRAYRETPVERIRRWARRNRGWVTAAVAAGFATMVILGVSLVAVNFAREEALEAERLKGRALESEQKQLGQTKSALQAEEAANAKARAALDTVTDEVVGRLLGKQANIGPEERKFLAKLIANYEQLAPGAADSASAKVMAAQAKLRVAQIYEKLGDQAEAAKQFRAAGDGFRELTTRTESTYEHRRGLSVAALGFAKAVLRSDGKAAIESMREGLLLREALYKEDMGNRQRTEDFLAALSDGADMMFAVGKFDQARPLYESIVNNYTQPLLKGQLGRDAAEVIGRAFEQLSLIAEQQKPVRVNVAYDHMDNAYGLFTTLHRHFPNEPSYLAQKNLALASRAMVKTKDKKYDEAEADLALALNELQPLVEQNPSVRSFRAGLGRTKVNAAIVANFRKNPQAAIDYLLGARAEFLRLRRDFPDEPEYYRALLAVTKELGFLHTDIGETKKADDYRAEALALEKNAPKDP